MSKLHSGKSWVSRLRPILTIAALAALAVATWRCRDALIELLSQTNPWLVVASVIAALLANCLTGIPFGIFLRQAGIQVPLRRSCYLQLVVQVTKYVPGNIWGAMLQAQLLASPRIGTLFVAGLDTSLFFVMTVSTTGISLLLLYDHVLLGLLTLILGWILSARIASSAWSRRSIEHIAILLGRKTGTQATPSDPRIVSSLLIIAVLHSLVLLLSLYFLLKATTDHNHLSLLIGIASICLSWVAGTLAVIIPSGIGVREAAFVYLASLFGVPASIENLTAIAVTIRVAQTLPDLLAGGIVAITEMVSPSAKR